VAEKQLQDVYISPGDLEWIPFSEGIQLKVLRVSRETGTWTVLFWCAQGSSFAAHRHLGAGEYLMLRGKMEVRGGAAAGGVTAVAGDYGYEPSGIVHDSTCFVEETEFFFTNHGPIAFIDSSGRTTSVLDWSDIEALAASALQPHAG